MKRILNTAAIYFALAAAAGVFYREFTKWNGFTGETVLGYAHTHLFVLGMFFFLITALFCRQEREIMEMRSFKRFYVIYNIALPLMVCAMLVRGITQVLGVSLTGAADASISGIAGISHILLTIALVLFFVTVKNALEGKEP